MVRCIHRHYYLQIFIWFEKRGPKASGKARDRWPFEFVVGNDLLGGDPMPGIKKTIKVLFRVGRKAALLETSRYVVVEAAEGSGAVVGL